MMARRFPALAAALACALPAPAADLSWSAFGTFGHARSDQDFRYERFIDGDGTFKRDSRLGLQATAEFSPHWSATVQARVAPSVSDDHRWDATLPWAFVSYRAGNDLLVRAGKLRMPMYLYSENMDVGASYAVARMPTEVYSTAPTDDYTGASFSKSWPLAWGDLSLDGYAGRTRVQPASAGGNGGGELRTRTAGLVLGLRHGDDRYHVGAQRAMIGFSHGNFSIPANGSGGDGGSGGGMLPSDSELDTRVWLLGADVGLGGDFRLVGEYARRRVANAVTPKNSRGAYASLLYQAGPWTPYVTVARLLSDKEARRANGNFDDQWSSALGISYSVTPISKLKAEWMRVNIGSGSSLAYSGANAGGSPGGASPVNGKRVNVMSLSYSFSY